MACNATPPLLLRRTEAAFLFPASSRLFLQYVDSFRHHVPPVHPAGPSRQLISPRSQSSYSEVHSHSRPPSHQGAMGGDLVSFVLSALSQSSQGHLDNSRRSLTACSSTASIQVLPRIMSDKAMAVLGHRHGIRGILVSIRYFPLTMVMAPLSLVRFHRNSHRRQRTHSKPQH
jgi:hypothetical protein